MKFEQALQYLKEGKKIARTTYKNNYCYYLAEDGRVKSEEYPYQERKEYTITASDVLEDDWIVYEPLLNDAEKDFMTDLCITMGRVGYKLRMFKKSLSSYTAAGTLYTLKVVFYPKSEELDIKALTVDIELKYGALQFKNLDAEKTYREEDLCGRIIKRD